MYLILMSLLIIYAPFSTTYLGSNNCTIFEVDSYCLEIHEHFLLRCACLHSEHRAAPIRRSATFYAFSNLAETFFCDPEDEQDESNE